MSPSETGRPTFWQTVRLLLAATRMRANGRRTRQQHLLNQRTEGKGTDWGGLGFLVFIGFMLFVNGGAAFMLREAVQAAQTIEYERLNGQIIVSTSFYQFASGLPFDSSQGFSNPKIPESLPREIVGSSDLKDACAREAKQIAENRGGSVPVIEKQLYDSVHEHGAGDLVTEDTAPSGLKALAKTGRLPAMLGSIVLFWWGIMLAFQGEGLEMDTQRRRHPIWEWLFSHPVPVGAVFLAEMLSPIAANPMYWGGPLFAGILFGFTYDPGIGILATALVGIPITVTAACLGKALEVGVILRLSPRTRGAVIGLMSWAGFSSMMLFMVGLALVPRVVNATAGFLRLFTGIPWPWLMLFLGGRSNGTFSFPSALLACWTASAVIIAASVWFSVWATQKGLSGAFASDAQGPSRTPSSIRFGREPLYRKEFLWFARDRSAIVQTILVPITVAGFQVFNLRGVLVRAGTAWNYLCGVAIFFGTYFLWILGPKSLHSEGTALWIALTWPRGLESLLKAKAWLWSMLSSGLVAIVLAYAIFSYPRDAWKILLVGVGWFFFSRSMAEKSVTLVTVTSSSGEPEKVPSGRRWAAQLGMLTFAVGIVTAQWQLAIIGIVYSYVTAAAMWQNFRARLPYLYDPWSEKVPPAPTLMHAMISISILVEASAVISIPFLAAGRENLAMGQAIGYATAAVVVSFFVSNFLRERDVRPQDIWCWLPPGQTIEENEPLMRRLGVGDREVLPAFLLAAAAGVALGAFAHGYLAVLKFFPATAEILRKSQEEAANVPNLQLWYSIMAIGFAPFAEEYLFRGLLYRSLDREWGGWVAVFASAAFFAIYHPPMAWVPVFLLGAANCVIFKKTRRLAPAVLLHMVYNTVVLLF